MEPKLKLDDSDEGFEPSLEQIQEDVLRSQQYQGEIDLEGLNLMPDPFEEVFGG